MLSINWIVIIIIVVILFIPLIIYLLSRLKGKIQITPGSFNYSPGDTVSGQLSLQLRKPVKASELSISLVGERVSYNSRRTGFSRQPNYQGSNRTVQTVYNVKQVLDGSKEYSSGERSYNFKIKLPKNMISNFESDNAVMNTIVKTAQVIEGVNAINWYLVGDLDAVGIDVKKKVQINIT